MKKYLLIPFMTMLCSVMTFGGTITVGDGGDHATLSEALTAASAGDEIQLLEDVTLDANITISKAITLNLNSHMISGEQKYLSVGAYDITLCNGTLFNNDTRNASTTDAIALFVNSGDSHSVTLHDIEIIATRPIIISTASSTVVFGNNVTLTTTFEGNSDATGKMQVYCQHNTNFTINEGATMNFTFQTASKKIISLTNNGTLTLGARFHANAARFSTVTNNGTLITTAAFTSATLTNTGTMTIAGGVYNGATIVNNGSATITNAEFSTAASTFSGDNNTLITGGTFNVAPSGTKGYIEPVTNCVFVEGVGELTIAEGYVWRESDGLIVPAPPTTVAATLKHLGGSQNYAYVESAFADAVSGDSIILMDDYTTSAEIKIGTANVSDPSRTLVLDLNGHTLTSASSVERTFLLMHGKLHIINSVPGQGGIVNTHASGKAFFIVGTYQKSCNSRTAAIADLFTYLSIGDGVTIDATGDGGSSIVVDIINKTTTFNTNYSTRYIQLSDNQSVRKGLANGVRVDVKGNVHANKYGIKINGYVSYPNPALYTRAEYDAESTVAESDTVYSAFIHVYPSANVTVPSDVEEAAPIYTGGYGRILMEGKCQGATGLYMKSGFVVLNNAIVESKWLGNAVVVKGLESGIKAGGNAIVVESDATVAGYPGHAVLIVNGDTKAQTSATGGAALVDAVNTTGNSTIDKVTINGGTFIGDYAIVISEQTAESADAEVVIHGVSLVGDVEVAQETGVAAVNSIIDLSAVHTTVLDNGSKTTIIVSAGSNSPIEITNFGTSADPQEDEIVDIAEQQDRPDANWTGTNPGEVSEGTTVALGELQIISGTSENGGQQLTVGENATLQVERLIMNEYATIVVEAGGKLIVDGTQGINAPEESNIILETSETDQATFLFNPEVTSNRHPMATVKLTTKARQTAANDYIYERFTIPTMDGNATTYGAENLGSVVTYDGGEFKQALYKWNGSDWEFMPSFKAMNPFQGYQLTNNSANGEVVYTFEGNLVGNTDNDYNFVESGFGFFGNSYSADINIGKLFESFEGSDMQKTIWIYDYITDGFKTITPESYGSVKYGTRKNPQGVITDIRSMQAFLMNKATAGTATVDYESAIWGNPKYGLVSGGSGAPAKRVAAEDRDYITIYVANETSEDEVTFIRSNEYSNTFDNGADASKWMNNGINLYATTEEGDLAAVATNDIINMTIAFRSGNETVYTLGFDNLSGEEYAIRDILTGAVVNMEEGATYTFTQEANTTIPARFQIIGAHKMPTGMETLEEGTAVQQKVIMNGVLYILRDTKRYNAQGQIVK